MTLSLRSKFIMFFAITSTLSMIVLSLTLNSIINSKFQQYISENQKKRESTIVQYFEQIYLKDKKWSKLSGTELMHQAMSQGYVLSLLDTNKKIIWQMDEKMVMYHQNLMGHSTTTYNAKIYSVQADKKIVGYVKIGQYGDLLFTPQDIAFRKSVRWGLVLSFFGSLIISLMIGLVLSKQLSMPIKKIRKVAEKLKQGQLEARLIEDFDTIEIESLKQSINHLGVSLHEQEMLRKQLAADVSHELRTPLYIVQSQLEAFMDGIIEPTYERLQGCHEEIGRLTELVKELEKLTQVETNITLNKETVNLSEMIKTTADNFEAQFVQKNIQLQCEVESDLYVQADKSRVSQVFINLFSNAYKFTDEGGIVKVTSKRERNKILIMIEDNGQGIKKEDISKIFERFYRGEKSRNRKTGGAGIGLAIVKAIIDAHGWDIQVKSEEDKGTLFVISIPI